MGQVETGKITGKFRLSAFRVGDKAFNYVFFRVMREWKVGRGKGQTQRPSKRSVSLAIGLYLNARVNVVIVDNGILIDNDNTR